MTFLSVRDVHKAFDGVPVLRGMTVEVELHEVVALIGASGSGKSTLLRCIDGLVEVDAGRIRLEDEDPIEISAPDVDIDAVRRRAERCCSESVRRVSGSVSSTNNKAATTYGV